jgi:hypothetical protein
MDTLAMVSKIATLLPCNGAFCSLLHIKYGVSSDGVMAQH